MSQQRRASRVIVGELVPTGSPDLVARERFLVEAFSLSEGLRTALGPLVPALARARKDTCLDLLSWRELSEARRASVACAALADGIDALQASFNLHERDGCELWLRDALVLTISATSRKGDVDVRLRPRFHFLPDAPERVVIEDRAYKPWFESREEARDRLIRRVDEHIEEVTRAYHGWTSSSPARVRHAEGLHVEWCVRYQVCGESKSAIAKRARTTVPAVSAGIGAAAARIGLALRAPAAGGRPRSRNR